MNLINLIKEEYKNILKEDNNIISFGKYKGKTIDEIAIENPSYLNWIVDNIIPKNKDQQIFIDNIKQKISTLPTKTEKRNIKTIKLYIPNELILKKIKSTPTLNQWFRNELKVGDNIENVNHVQFHNIMRLFSLDNFKNNGVTVNEMV